MHSSIFTRTRRSFRLVIGLIACSASALAQAPTTSGCQLQWVPGFGGTSGMSAAVNCLYVYDDGSGSALFACGDFANAGGVVVNRIARWDGATWYSVGGGLTFGDAYAMVGADLGSGPRLFAAGTFVHAGSVPANKIAQWDGTSWAPLGLGLYTPLQHPFVYCLEPFDDGSGPALYAGGDFEWAGSVQSPSIAKWDGTAWSAVGGGITGAVRTCKTFDDGSGPALYVGGSFTMAGGLPISYLARWNGSAWSSVGGPFDDRVNALRVIDDGSGPALYASGSFNNAGGVALNHLGKWDGTAWQPVGSGLAPTDGIGDFAWYDDGSGPALFASCSLPPVGGVPLHCIAKWGGTSWLPLGSGFNNNGGAYSLAGFTAGSDHGLYAGGFFYMAGGVPSSFVAKWAYTPGCGQPAVELCFPGNGGVIPCPCGNPAVILGTGCDNSSSTGGAVLWATGIASLAYDTVLLRTVGERPTATSLVLQGSTLSGTGFVFGQGVRCVSGSLKRLYLKTADAGGITAPVANDLCTSAQSAALGSPIAPGTHRYYGVYYRDPVILGGCPATSGFNITQQLDILWSP